MYWQNLEINDAFLFLQLQSFTSFDGPISGDKSELLTTSSQALLHFCSCHLCSLKIS